LLDALAVAALNHAVVLRDHAAGFEREPEVAREAAAVAVALYDDRLFVVSTFLGPNPA